ncbi:MAG: vWA domain-containing protein, partial [Tangfeifania sp.]
MKKFLPRLNQNYQVLLIILLLGLFFVSLGKTAIAQDTIEAEQQFDPFFDHDKLGKPVYVGEVPPLNLPQTGNYSSLKSGTINNNGQNLLKSALTDLEWPDPGSVQITKWAEATSTDGRWKINLKVEGKNIPTTSDVVLVIDDSGSMSGSKMTDAKSAAKTFVDEVIDGSGNIRIAVVTLNGGSGGLGTPQLDINFSSDADALKNTIDDINASGGTNLQGGFYMARGLISSSTADKKSIVLMSDGVPTYSYESDVETSEEPEHNCNVIGGNWNMTSDELEEYLYVNSSNYTNVVGNGSSFNYTLYSFTDDCWWGNPEITAGNHGMPTKYEAGLITDMGVDVYTVGFDVPDGGDAEDVLEGSQNKGYYPANSGNLNQVYSEIASNIAYAATNAILTDPMSTYIVLESSDNPPTWAVEPNTADV